MIQRNNTIVHNSYYSVWLGGFFLDENIEEYWNLAKNGKNSSASIKQESIVNQHSFSQLIHYLSYAPQCVNQKYWGKLINQIRRKFKAIKDYRIKGELN